MIEPAVPAAAQQVQPRIPKRTDVPTLALSGVLALVLAASGFVNIGFASRFPSNAPIEQVWAFGISVDLWAAALALTIRFAILMRRPHGPGPALAGPGKLAIAAAIITGVFTMGWLALGGANFLGTLITGDRLRYYLDVNGAFLLGFAWMTGLVLGVVAYRPGRSLQHAIVCAVAIVLPLLIVATSLFSAVVYGLGLSD